MSCGLPETPDLIIGLHNIGKMDIDVFRVIVEVFDVEEVRDLDVQNECLTSADGLMAYQIAMRVMGIAETDPPDSADGAWTCGEDDCDESRAIYDAWLAAEEAKCTVGICKLRNPQP